jgi:hypothetical protein
MRSGGNCSTRGEYKLLATPASAIGERNYAFPYSQNLAMKDNFPRVMFVHFECQRVKYIRRP